MRPPHWRGRLRSLRLVTALFGVISVGASLAPTTATAAEPVPLPTPRGLVSDFANVIDAQTEASLTARLTEIQQKTGAEIAVVTIATTAPDDVFDYAMRLAETWKPGARDKDNGIVFLTAVADRKMHVLTGYGLEGTLPDGLVGEIRDRVILPRYRTGDYAGGIVAGVEQLGSAIAREYGVELVGMPVRRRALRGRASRRTDGIPILLFFLLSFVILPNLRHIGRRRRHGLWMGPMWGAGFGGGGFGGRGGGFGGGFGGFGGGGFGGGGAGGSW